MNRRNRRTSALLLAVALLIAALAPAAAAEPPRSPLGWLDHVGQSVASWWTVLTGEGSGPRSLFAASEVAPEIDPNGNPVSPDLDPNGSDATTSTGFEDGNDVSPDLDPDG